MKTCVGLAIAYDALRAVVVRGGAIVWSGEAAREPEASLSDSIVALLASAPLPRRRRPALTVAVGPHASQVKRIEGLPPIEEAELLSAIVRESPSAFFLQGEVALCVTGVRVAAPGAAWAAAIDAPCVESVRHASARLRVRLASVAPVAVVLPRALIGERIHYADGPVAIDVEVSEAGITAVRRLPRPSGESTSAAEALPALAPLGEHATRFADAYGAAVAPAGDPLTLGAGGDAPWDRRRFRARVVTPAIIALAAAAVLLLSPVMPLVAARRAEAALREIQTSEEWRLTVQVQAQLQRATGVLSEIEGFAASRPSRAHLLAELARALPDSTAIERLDVRGGEITMLIVTTDAASATAAVRAVPGVVSVTVSNEAASATEYGRELERATLVVQYTSVARDHAAGDSEH